ncbi:hypothetical protein EDD16DRAFT_108527 [Pisolithus croceorrhizus]|nr:hypothetical protein EDD16DRAFT_108527 [Pisolithus croceorrhizus]
MDAVIRPSCSLLFPVSLAVAPGGFLFFEPQVPSWGGLLVTTYVLRSLAPYLRSAPVAAFLCPQIMAVVTVLPRCVALRCLCGLQDLFIMKRNLSCPSAALLHSCFQVPYRPAHIQRATNRPQRLGKVIANSPNSSSSARKLSRPQQ